MPLISFVSPALEPYVFEKPEKMLRSLQSAACCPEIVQRPPGNRSTGVTPHAHSPASFREEGPRLGGSGSAPSTASWPPPEGQGEDPLFRSDSQTSLSRSLSREHTSQQVSSPATEGLWLHPSLQESRTICVVPLNQ